MKPDIEELYQNQILEFRRGSIVLAIVAVLSSEQLYGYSLLKRLEKHGLLIEGNTLYPLLRRLERQGILSSTWDTTDTRPRKYYKLTNDGRMLHERLVREWSAMTKNITQLVKEKV